MRGNLDLETIIKWRAHALERAGRASIAKAGPQASIQDILSEEEEWSIIRRSAEELGIQWREITPDDLDRFCNPPEILEELGPIGHA